MAHDLLTAECMEAASAAWAEYFKVASPAWAEYHAGHLTWSALMVKLAPLVYARRVKTAAAWEPWYQHAGWGGATSPTNVATGAP